MGIASLSGILVRPGVGYILDHKGRRGILWIGSLIFLFTHLFYLFIDHLGVGLFLVRLLHGLGVGTLIATFFTLAIDLTPPLQRIRGISLFAISGQLGGTLCIPIAEALVQRYGFQALFILCATMSVITLLLCLFIRDTAERDIPIAPYWKEALKANLSVPFLTTFIFAIGLASVMFFIKPYAISVGIHQIASFFIAYTGAAMGIRLIGSHWPEQYGIRSALIFALLSMALGIVLIVLIPSTKGLIVSGILCGTGHGLIVPILSGWVVSCGGESFRGGFMTLYTMVFDLGVLIGSPLLGLIVKQWSYTALYIAAAGLILLSIVVLLRYAPSVRF